MSGGKGRFCCCDLLFLGFGRGTPTPSLYSLAFVKSRFLAVFARFVHLWGLFLTGLLTLGNGLEWSAEGRSEATGSWGKSSR